MAPTYTHVREFCANVVPLAYKNRPYLGKCGNSEELSLLILLSLFVAGCPCIPASTVCGTEGRTFESCRVRQPFQRITTFYILKITKLCHFCAIEF